MLTLADMRSLKVHDQFVSYAHAYRSASAMLCRQMETDDTGYTWPHATVILMLAAHAVELFLKGALQKRTGMIIETHDIQQLSEKYREAFQDAAFAWDIPFAIPLSETEQIAQAKELWPEIDQAAYKESIKAAPKPSVLYRYPKTFPSKEEKKKGVKGPQEWRGAYGFTTPTEFLTTLDQLGQDFNRLKLELDKLPDPPHGRPSPSSNPSCSPERK